jgi:dCTP deaminase
MGVLADDRIFELLRSGELIVHPILDEEKQISGGRIDLRLDNVLYFIKRFEKEFYDPMIYIEKEPERYVEERVIPYNERFVLHPNDYALAPLFEFVKIPENLVGRLDGRSSLGRLGVVVHSTAGAVDPDYSGPLIMELMNHGMLPVVLYPLMRIATLTLLDLRGKARKYEGKYKGLREFFGVESRLHEDKDLEAIAKAKKSGDYL